jgi:uncharacterized sporulation protein YeaH/YhbH (DUF444 family)
VAFLIIDRRLNGKHKSAVNRQRFLRRYHAHIKQAVADSLSKRGITDLEHGEEISIPRKDISEPSFRHGRGGRQTRVFPGNKEFTRGDKIKRPSGGGGGGGGPGDASDSGEGMDEFVFELTQEEFLEYIFEDLELPNLVKKQLKDSDSYKLIKGGYTNVGIPARLNVIQTLRSAYGRRIALGGAIKGKIARLKAELANLEEGIDSNDQDSSPVNSDDRAREIRIELERLERRLHHVPFLDDFDLRYNNIIEMPTPTTSAVMLCLMDVSGSMTQDIKDMAKRFYMLLYMFLKRNYQKIEVVFIRHHTSAKEVDEEEFFYSRETGGTIVSSAIKLMYEIVRDRYPATDWNIYAAQASDGDNWADDSPLCRELLVNKILPLVQYYAYVEITPREHQALWRAYEDMVDLFPQQFAMQQIESVHDIYPVFHDLFERKSE